MRRIAALAGIFALLGCGSGTPDEVPIIGTPVVVAPININFTGFAGGHNDGFQSVARDPVTTQIYAAGWSHDSSGRRQGMIARYTNAGVLDTTFNAPSGYVLTGASGLAGGSSDVFNSMTLDAAGNILVAGTSKDTIAKTRAVVAKYTAAGALDTAGFGAPSGFVLAPSGGFAGGASDTYSSIALHSGSNAVYCAGMARDSTGIQRTVLARYVAAGILDTAAFSAPNGYVLGPGAPTGFGGGGADIWNSVYVDQATAVAVVGGSTVNGTGDSQTLVARYTAAGVLDVAGFNAPDGFVVGPGNGFANGRYDMINSLTLDGAGRIHAAGMSWDISRNSKSLMLRYTAAGVLDTGTFNNPFGYRVGANTGERYLGISLDPVSGNSLAVGGALSASLNELLVSRASVNGSLDVTFGTAGVVKAAISNSGVLGDAIVTSVLVDPTQSVVIGGNTFFTNGYQEPFLRRYDSTGVRDF